MRSPNSGYIAIITDDPGWHGRQLVDAFRERGCLSHYVRLQDCHFNLNADQPPYLEVGNHAETPLGVFIRGVPGGSLEEVVYYLDILHAFEAMAIPVVNNVRSIERSVDKGMTSFLLSLQGIPTPKTFISSDLHYIHEKLREGLNSGSTYVVKPLFGSQGLGLQWIRSMREFIDYEHMNGVMYLQEHIHSGHGVGVDFRVFVVGGQIVSSMKRIGTSWISNVAHGARVEPVVLDSSVEEMAVEAVRVVGMEYAGVDLIRDTQGKFWVTEVNSVPAWKGLQPTTSKVIVDSIVDDFLSRVNCNIQT